MKIYEKIGLLLDQCCQSSCAFFFSMFGRNVLNICECVWDKRKHILKFEKANRKMDLNHPGSAGTVAAGEAWKWTSSSEYYTDPNQSLKQLKVGTLLCKLMYLQNLYRPQWKYDYIVYIYIYKTKAPGHSSLLAPLPFEPAMQQVRSWHSSEQCHQEQRQPRGQCRWWNHGFIKKIEDS